MRKTRFKRIAARLANCRGVTLAETLMAMLIMLIAIAVAVGAIPPAVRSYQNTVDAANAQVLLSTAMVRLRDELGKARSWKVQNGAVSYITGRQTSAEIYRGTVEERDGVRTGTLVILIRESGSTETQPDPNDEPQQLVSREASTGTLYVTYESVTPDENDDAVVVFKGLEVKNGQGATLASAGEYKVRTMQGMFD